MAEQDPRDVEIAALKQLLKDTINEKTLRATPRIGELIDALNNLTRGAQLGSLPAKEALKQLFEALDAARDATSALTVIRSNGN